jgi:hypothetical protein
MRVGMTPLPASHLVPALIAELGECRATIRVRVAAGDTAPFEDKNGPWRLCALMLTAGLRFS